MALASGEYIAFVDSDDWVSDVYVEVMMNVMQKNDADIVECDFIRTVGVTEEILMLNGEPEIISYSTTDAMRHLIIEDGLYQTVWNKLYKRTVVDDIIFEYGKYNEDEFWTYQIFGRAKRIVKVRMPLYYYFQNQNSIMGQGYTIRRLDGVEAKTIRQTYIDDKFPELSDVAAINCLSSIIYAGQMTLIYLSEEEKRIAFDNLKKLSRIIYSKKYPLNDLFKRRIWLKMACVNLRCTCAVRNLLKINI